jgi:membrane protein YdbS with pleckstrin-like domain
MPRTEEISRWVYEGIWGVLAKWFRVPREPPQLPAQEGESIESFRPADGFLRYLKLQFWVWLALVDVVILILWIVVTINVPWLGAALAIPALVIAVLPDIIAYVAIHLRYDTTWYVMSDRSLRIRRGIWVIRETTITFENVQNVSVRQGPLQRWFAISDVIVETAGGGQSSQGSHGAEGVPSHLGLIEGIADATKIRDMILTHLRKSRTAGLGDEDRRDSPIDASWRPLHLEVLREIRDAANALAADER